MTAPSPPGGGAGRVTVRYHPAASLRAMSRTPRPGARTALFSLFAGSCLLLVLSVGRASAQTDAPAAPAAPAAPSSSVAAAAPTTRPAVAATAAPTTAAPTTARPTTTVRRPPTTARAAAAAPRSTTVPRSTSTTQGGDVAIPAETTVPAPVTSAPTTTAAPVTTVVPSTTQQPALQQRASESDEATTRLNRVVIALLALAGVITAVTVVFWRMTRPQAGRSTGSRAYWVDEEGAEVRLPGPDDVDAVVVADPGAWSVDPAPVIAAPAMGEGTDRNDVLAPLPSRRPLSGPYPGRAEAGSGAAGPIVIVEPLGAAEGPALRDSGSDGPGTEAPAGSAEGGWASQGWGDDPSRSDEHPDPR